mmetsp:Transcript_2613/g.3488  ORF Transcript_2613/g.3488 Transcript_2613/m.3488 type:complete len:89 (+) Transcript_2613:700-966(+)
MFWRETRAGMPTPANMYKILQKRMDSSFKVLSMFWEEWMREKKFDLTSLCLGGIIFHDKHTQTHTSLTTQAAGASGYFSRSSKTLATL